MKNATIPLVMAILVGWVTWFAVGCEPEGAGKKPVDVAADVGTGGQDTAAPADVPADVPDEGAEPWCGDNVCAADEDPCSCPLDCGEAVCCDDTDCPQPSCGPCCHSICAEGACQVQWVSPCCWNGLCEEGEDASNCPEDCPADACGNGSCDLGEDAFNCPADCQPGCGNGTCDPGEDALHCPADCQPVCGNGSCDPGEDSCGCPQDCGQPECCDDADCPQPLCGPCCHAFCVEGSCVDQWDAPCCWNGICEPGEDASNCPQDCEAGCGNGICNPGENPDNCPLDCPVTCGDGFCDPGEDGCWCPSDCPEPACCVDSDCPQPKCGPCCHAWCIEGTCVEKWDAPCCWNGICEPGEDFKTCPQDCPEEEVTQCAQDGGVCVPWDPQYSKCPPGTKPSGLACSNKSQVCCQKETNPPCDYFACKTDDDCVKSQAGCCDCANGGVEIAVAKQCLEAWMDLVQLDCALPVACLAVYLCTNKKPICEDGACTLSK